MSNYVYCVQERRWKTKRHADSNALLYLFPLFFARDIISKKIILIYIINIYIYICWNTPRKFVIVSKLFPPRLTIKDVEQLVFVVLWYKSTISIEISFYNHLDYKHNLQAFGHADTTNLLKLIHGCKDIKMVVKKKERTHTCIYIGMDAWFKKF
jgi:hypothetical protein